MSITSGYTFSCADLACAGGVKEIYLANKEDIDSITEAAGVVSAITMVLTKVFFKIDFLEETAVFTETGATTNCNRIVTKNLQFVFPCWDVDQRNFIEEAASTCCGLAVYMILANGKQVVFGVDGDPFDRPRLIGDEFTSGTTLEDQMQTTLTIESRDIKKAYETTVDIATLI